MSYLYLCISLVYSVLIYSYNLRLKFRLRQVPILFTCPTEVYNAIILKMSYDFWMMR